MLLLDTDVLIDLLRGYDPARQWLQSRSDEKLMISGFSLMELIQGCRNAADIRAVRQFTESFSIIWPGLNDCHAALELFAQYRLSHGIGMIDAFIARIALSIEAPLHTFNKKHFAPIPDLTTVQPYAKPESG